MVRTRFFCFQLLTPLYFNKCFPSWLFVLINLKATETCKEKYNKHLYSQFLQLTAVNIFLWVSLVAQIGRNLPANAGDVGLIPGLGRFPGWEDSLEKEMATHSSILAWEIQWTEGAWQATVHGVAKRVRHDLATKQQQQTTIFSCIYFQ